MDVPSHHRPLNYRYTRTAAEVDVERLPIGISHEKDVGTYITAGVAAR
jgi:UbiD family decarboxylase